MSALEQFEQQQLPMVSDGIHPDWRRWRQAQWQRCQDLPAASAKLESWRHFEAMSQMTLNQAMVPRAQCLSSTLTAEQAAWLADIKQQSGVFVVLVDGCFRPDLSTDSEQLLAGLTIESVRDFQQHSKGLEAVKSQYEAWFAHRDCTHWFPANAALANDGVYLRLADDSQLSAPIYCICLSTPSLTQPLLLSNYFIFGANSQAKVIMVEYADSKGQEAWQQVTSFWQLATGAKVRHERLAGFGNPQSVYSHHHYVDQQAHSDYFGLRLILDGQAQQDMTSVALNGTDAEATVYSLACPTSGQQHQGVYAVSHRAPGTISEHVAKMLVGKAGRGICYSDVTMVPGVDGAVSKQTNRNLTLHDSAAIFTQPRLSIHHDQVQCAHGASMGRLDANMVQYMCSRGLSYDQAVLLLMQGFTEEMIALADVDWCSLAARQQLAAQQFNLCHKQGV